MSRDIPVHLIEPDPEQPRKHFDPIALHDLAQSIQTVGLASPILLRPAAALSHDIPDERYIIVHGERRWRAAQSLGWETIPAIIRDLDPDDARWLSLIENIQREDLTPMEEAEAYQARLTTGLTQEDLGRRIGKSQSAIAQKLRLLALPEPIAIYVRRGALSEGHVRALLRIKGWFHDLADQWAGRNDRNGEQQELSDTGLVVTTLSALRPEDNPPGGFSVAAAGAKHPVVADACRAMATFIDANCDAMPLWALHGFWWATFAVVLQVSVGNLSIALDRWHERMLHVIGWNIAHRVHSSGSSPDGEGRLAHLDRMARWGHRSDLRHLGLSRHVDNRLIPDALLREATRFISNGTELLPSSMQSWGQLAAEGRELRRLESGDLWDEDEADAEISEAPAPGGGQ